MSLDIFSGTPSIFCFTDRFSILFFLLAHILLALMGAEFIPHSSTVSVTDTMAFIVP